jgi:hypothetical protein
MDLSPQQQYWGNPSANKKTDELINKVDLISVILIHEIYFLLKTMETLFLTKLKEVKSI